MVKSYYVNIHSLLLSKVVACLDFWLNAVTVLATNLAKTICSSHHNEDKTKKDDTRGSTSEIVLAKPSGSCILPYAATRTLKRAGTLRSPKPLPRQLIRCWQVFVQHVPVTETLVLRHATSWRALASLLLVLPPWPWRQASFLPLLALLPQWNFTSFSTSQTRKKSSFFQVLLWTAFAYPAFEVSVAHFSLSAKYR